MKKIAKRQFLAERKKSFRVWLSYWRKQGILEKLRWGLKWIGIVIKHHLPSKKTFLIQIGHLEARSWPGPPWTTFFNPDTSHWFRPDYNGEALTYLYIGDDPELERPLAENAVNELIPTEWFLASEIDPPQELFGKNILVVLWTLLDDDPRFSLERTIFDEKGWRRAEGWHVIVWSPIALKDDDHYNAILEAMDYKPGDALTIALENKFGENGSYYKRKEAIGSDHE